MKVEISDTKITTRSGISKRNQPYTIHTQSAWLHKEGAPYPTEFKINLENGQPPYAAGEYTIDLAKSIFIDRYDSISIKPVLVQSTKANLRAAQG